MVIVSNVISRINVASVGNVFNDTRKVKVLSLLLSLGGGGRGSGKNYACFLDPPPHY